MTTPGTPTRFGYWRRRRPRMRLVVTLHRSEFIHQVFLVAGVNEPEKRRHS